jgi:sec-independent protein translocase protein TatA
MFGTLGGPELFLIFVVALIVFGPRKLPEIGKSLGKMMAEFRKASNDFRNTIESEVEAEKIRDSLRIDPPRIEPPKVEPVTSHPETHAGGHEPAAGVAAAAAADAPAPLVEPVAEAVSRETTSTGADHK